MKAVARDEDDFEDFDELFRVNEPQLPLRPVVSPRGGRISALENERSGLGSDEMSIVEGESSAARRVKHKKKACPTFRSNGPTESLSIRCFVIP